MRRHTDRILPPPEIGAELRAELEQLLGVSLHYLAERELTSFTVWHALQPEQPAC